MDSIYFPEYNLSLREQFINTVIWFLKALLCVCDDVEYHHHGPNCVEGTCHYD